MVDLLVLTSLDQLLLILKIFLPFFTKQANLIWRSIVLSLPCQSVFPGSTNQPLVSRGKGIDPGQARKKPSATSLAILV